MAVTIGTNVRGWWEVGGLESLDRWTAHVVWDTGSALYAVVQDTGATPKVRVFKGNSYPNPTSFSEVDSANNKAIANVIYPYDSWLAGTNLHIAAFTNTNTLTHYLFDTSTDQWGTGHGNISTTVSNERAVRLGVRSDGDVVVAAVNSTDDADIQVSLWEGSSWSTSVTIDVTSAEASIVFDAVMDSTDRFHYFVYLCGTIDDYEWHTWKTNNTSQGVDGDATAGTVETRHSAGCRYNPYEVGGVDTVIGAYVNSDNTLREIVFTLEQDAVSGGVSAETAISATTTFNLYRSPFSTAVIGGVPYAAWWDDDNSGTIKYSTKSSGTWAAETAFATSTSKLIEIVPVANNTALMVVYQSGNNVVMDWFIAPPAVPVDLGTAAAAITTGASATELTRSVELAGTAAITSGASATELIRSVALAGTAAITTDATATEITRSIAFAGTAAITTDATATTLDVTAEPPQIVAPTADVSAGGWTTNTGATTNLYEAVNEPSPDDDDYIQSPESPGTPAAVRLRFASLDTPVAGPHIIRYRHGRDTADGPDIQLTARLYQGSTLIATDTPIVPTTTWTTREWTIAGEDVDAITSYGDLRIDLEALEV